MNAIIVIGILVAIVFLVARAAMDKPQPPSRGDGSDALLAGTVGGLDSGSDASHHNASHGDHGHSSFDGGHGGFDGGHH